MIVPVLQVVITLVVSTFAFFAGWSIQHDRMTAQIETLKRAQAEQHAIALENARNETARMQRQKDEAERLAAIRQRNLARAVSAAGDELGRVRDELASARSAVPGATCGAVREYAATAATVFGECAAAAAELARKADGHAADTLKLLEAWPTDGGEQ